MTRNRLKADESVPVDFHVARYCFPGTVRTVNDGVIRMVVSARAFENRKNPAAGVSFSVMQWFCGATDEEIIYRVCEYRGDLRVKEGGDYVKLGAGSVVRSVSRKGTPPSTLIFRPGKNPAHAALLANSLSVSTALSALANRDGKFFPVPSPLPTRKVADCHEKPTSRFQK